MAARQDLAQTLAPDVAARVASATCKLRAEISDVFPPGPQSDVWLAWLAELAVGKLEAPSKRSVSFLTTS
jgi:hypothetical protein